MSQFEIVNKAELDDWLFEHAQVQGHILDAVKAPLRAVEPGDQPAELYNVAWIDRETNERIEVVYREVNK